MSCIFTNDNNVEIKLLENVNFYYNKFSVRNNHEVIFRKIHSNLINKNIIKNNIIDLGAWIGDNSIPWAKQITGTVYAIDPSPNNIAFINEMSKLNNINNIKTFEKAISDKTEDLYTNDDINHCSFNNTKGKTKTNSCSLDYLYNMKLIDNIGYIHLDVEGFEKKIIMGSSLIIETFHPIITFEQHIELDDYIFLSNYLSKKNYDVYLINEVLPGCRFDCRNFIAFPEELDINIKDIHDYLNEKILLLISQSPKQQLSKHLPNQQYIYSATIYGYYFKDREYHDVHSIKHNIEPNLYLFAVNDDKYTKIIAINDKEEWMDARHILGEVNKEDPETIINAYDSAYKYTHTKYEYNIKNIRKINYQQT